MLPMSDKWSGVNDSPGSDLFGRTCLCERVTLKVMDSSFHVARA